MSVHDEALGLLSRLMVAVKERNEALAEVEHAYREGGALYEAKIAQAEAEMERDAARTEAARLTDELRQAKEWARERSEFAAAETGHANRWAARAHAAEAEVERLRPRIDAGRGLTVDSTPIEFDYAGVRRQELAAYHRGAEAMREALALAVLPSMAHVIRALPIPEEVP